MKKQSFKQLKTTAVADKDNRNGNKNYYFMKTLKLLPFVFLLFLAQLKVYAQIAIPLSSGLSGSVECQAVYNGEVYVGGQFTIAGGVSAIFIAKWNGTTWSAVGSGTNDWVYSMAVYNGELYVGGNFTTAGGVSSTSNIAKWNGTTWSAVGSIITIPVRSMAVYNGELYVGGYFTTVGGVGASNIAKWNGTAWSAVGSGITGLNNDVISMAVYNGELYVGGYFTTAGGVGVNRIAKWNGTAWSAVGSGTNNSVNSMAVYNGDLYVGGAFTTAGGVSASKIAKWNGTTWSAVGSGANDGYVNSMAVFNGDLYVGGYFTTAGSVSANCIAKWNGTAWSAVGSGTNGWVYSMAVFNGELYVVGEFTTAFGVSANRIVKIRQMKEPNIASSNLQFTNISTNGLTLSWTNGNGKKRLVVAKASSAVNQVPIDTQAYIANASFSTGSNLGNGNYVVYNGTGNTVNVTNLNADNVYHFAIFELNDSTISKYENYLTSTYPTSNRTTLATEPTTSASNISFSQKTVNSFKVSFAQGNGSKRIVVARQGSLVDKAPDDTIDYIANLSFGTINTDLGNGNFVVYNGTGNSFTLTNLIGNTNYYFAVYEYNGSSPKANNYLINSPATGIGATIKLEPTVASNSIQYTNVSVNGLNLTWNNGNGTKHLVVAKASSSVNLNPIDTQTYTANASFGTGTNLGNGNYVIYNGTGNFVNISNLSAETIYYFKIFEFNDSATNGYENYLTSNFVSSSHTTLATEPTSQSSKVSFSDASFTNMNVTITPGNGSKRIVIAKQGSVVNKTPEDTFGYIANSVFGTTGTDLGGGNFVVYNGSGNTFNLSGITANTIYYFKAFEYNGSTPPALNYLLSSPASGYQSTLTTEPTSPSANIQFTNVKDSSMTLSWTVGNGQRRLVVAATSAITTFPTDGVDHLANDTFSKGADLGFENYVVYSGTSNTFNVKGLIPNTTYHFAIFEFSGTNTSNNYLLTNPATGSKSTLIAEPTTAASNLTLSPITNGITTVNWTNGNGDNRIVIARQGAPINILPEDGKSYTANAVFGSGQDLGQGNFVCYIGNNNTFNLQGLDPSNLYYIGVVEYNGSGGGSNYKVNLFPIADNLPAEPTTLASNMSFTNVTANSVKVNWTNGNGAYRILVAKEASVVTKKPTDGTVYVANNAFGSGADLGLANFVVYNGVANSATITNLNNNSKYHFSLFEFNKDASGPANYANNSLNGSVDIGNPQGVQDVLENNKISVFPNPTSGIITLSSNQTIATIDVFDVAGKLVYSIKNNSKQTNTEIDLSTLSNGIYFIHAKTENGGVSKCKVVVSK